MLKKAAVGVVGLLLAASLFFASAQVTSDMLAQIQSLLAQVQQLQALLQQLQQGQGGGQGGSR